MSSSTSTTSSGEPSQAQEFKGSSPSRSSSIHDDEEDPDTWPIWGQLINSWDHFKKKDPGYIREMVRNGIPSHFRGIGWQLLCDAQVAGGSNKPLTFSNPKGSSSSSSSFSIASITSSAVASFGLGLASSSSTSSSVSSASSTNGTSPSSASNHNPLNNNNNLGSTNGHHPMFDRNSIRGRYMEYLKQSSPCEKMIKRDIARTFPELSYFRDEKGPGQIGLYNVMKAFSIHDSEVGYCQGSAFLVGLLLLQMPEEDAFAVLVKMMEEPYRMREMYKPTMAELGLLIYQLECMVQELLPELHRHFESQNYNTSMYASSWFLTLFTSCLPLNLAARVIDLFLSEGIEMIFRISIGILIICKEDLLRLDMEGLLKYFQKEMPARVNADPDYLISQSMSFKYDSKKLKKYSKDYTVIKTKEQEEMVELRRLRTENNLLRQKNKILEKESEDLADKLIKGQVSRAEEAEDNFVMKRELANLKKKEQELIHKLEASGQQTQVMEQQVRTKAATTEQELHQIIDSLQEELVAVKLREAESADEKKHLMERIIELEEMNHRLRDLPPEHTVAQLQEELISVKLREAEANLSMKDLRNRIADLTTMLEEHLTSCQHSGSEGASQPNSLEKCASSLPPQPSLSVTSSPLKMLGNAVRKSADFGGELSRLKHELLTTKLRETETMSDLKETRIKVMELETQKQVSLNQIRRMNEDLNRFKENVDECTVEKRNLNKQLQQEVRKFIDLDSRYKEQQMMNRIKDLEQTQAIAELKQKLSSVDIKREETLTAKKLIESGSEPENKYEMNKRMSELQSEMFRLDATNQKLNSFITSNEANS